MKDGGGNFAGEASGEDILTPPPLMAMFSTAPSVVPVLSESPVLNTLFVVPVLQLDGFDAFNGVGTKSP